MCWLPGILMGFYDYFPSCLQVNCCNDGFAGIEIAETEYCGTTTSNLKLPLQFNHPIHLTWLQPTHSLVLGAFLVICQLNLGLMGSQTYGLVLELSLIPIHILDCKETIWVVSCRPYIYMTTKTTGCKVLILKVIK